MKTVAVEDPTLTVSKLVEMAESEPVVVTRNGQPIAGMLELDEGDIEAWSLGSNPDFIAMIERSRERGRREGAISLDEVRRRLALPADTKQGE